MLTLLARDRLPVWEMSLRLARCWSQLQFIMVWELLEDWSHANPSHKSIQVMIDNLIRRRLDTDGCQQQDDDDDDRSTVS